MIRFIVTHFEEADATSSVGSGEMFVVIKVYITQEPGVGKFLTSAIKPLVAAQMPSYLTFSGKKRCTDFSVKYLKDNVTSQDADRLKQLNLPVPKPSLMSISSNGERVSSTNSRGDTSLHILKASLKMYLCSSTDSWLLYPSPISLHFNTLLVKAM